MFCGLGLRRRVDGLGPPLCPPKPNRMAESIFSLKVCDCRDRKRHRGPANIRQIKRATAEAIDEFLWSRTY
jgi:hypothetical protein